MSADHLYKKLEASFPFFEVLLDQASDDDLVALGIESGTGLSLDELKRIKDHFADMGRNPSDVELQSLGQAWSEHCCYKSSKTILRDFVFGIDNAQVIDRGDAGVMEFDDDHAYSLRIESHNHPSAVEPYGGAATGIGGIVRDVLCMGCQPIALIDPLYFGNLDYPHDELPKGTKHPTYLLGGVVSGIRDYGNRIGIPTVSGGIFFDDSYLGNCLVNVGCVGIARKDDLYENKVGGVGDNLILVGGHTGRDGIHGVTFASAVLTDKSETESRGAVQLGDPIMKEPLIHAVLDVGRKKLITGMKDLGGGGLSCVCGELALAAGYGVDVYLDRVPLKEDGLLPWEIWVSESQERMMLAVTDDNIDKVLQVFKLYDVPATIIGKVIPEKIARVFFDGTTILEVGLEFLTGGPEYCRPRTIEKPGQKGQDKAPALPDDNNKILTDLLSDTNVCSRDWVIRQYDHEVRGSTAIKPLQGDIRHSTHGDASVMKPVADSWQGLAIAVAANPWLTSIDPLKGGRSVMDEMCRNIVAVGGRPHSLSNCLNFGNPEIPERLGEFHEAVKGLGEVAGALDLPIPSGNVSFYNETAQGSILPTVTVMGVGKVPDIRKSITSDIKSAGNSIYLIGQTKDEMGASLLYRKYDGFSSNAPDVDILHLQASIDKVLGAMDQGFILSCHDISDGGLAVTISEMCIGGGIGADLDIPDNGADISVELYSESNTRWLVEVVRGSEDDLETVMEGIPLTKLGVTSGKSLVISHKGQKIIDAEIEDLDKAWRSPLWDTMG
ncbi:MAG: phosphoribosylformylglycinamidine synthase subunit PurL [Thermoplasmata archaeon]|nr:phosphoribosylformylglycinamidine synthase subunit PurL [Thermoplasmata archaeon]